MKRLEMKNCDMILTKILALSSGKIDKYEYLAGEEILPLDQSRMIKQAKFSFKSNLKSLCLCSLKSFETN